MIRSRRQFLHSLGVGAAAGVAVRWPLDAVAASAGEPARAGQPAGPILLDSNENAYGPSPKVADAIRSASSTVNRYAFRKDAEVTERIAASHGVKPGQVLFGCGSTELMRAAGLRLPGKRPPADPGFADLRGAGGLCPIARRRSCVCAPRSTARARPSRHAGPCQRGYRADIHLQSQQSHCDHHAAAGDRNFHRQAALHQPRC